MFQYNLYPKTNYLLSTKEEQKQLRQRFKHLLNSLNNPVRLVCITDEETLYSGDTVRNTHYKLITGSEIDENIRNTGIPFSRSKCYVEHIIRTKEKRKYLEVIEGNVKYFARTIKIMQYPQVLMTAFINNILLPNTEISLTIHPLPQDEAVRLVKKKIEQTEATVLWKSSKNYNNDFFVEDEVLDKLKEIMIGLMGNEEKICLTGMYILLKGENIEDLDALTKKMTTLLSSLQINYKIANNSHFVCFRNFRDYKEIDHVKEHRIFLTGALSNFYPFSRYTQDRGITIGYDFQNNQLINLNFSQMFNLSWFIFGIPGSGKSFSVKSIIKKIAQYKKVYVLDIVGEYIPLRSKNIEVITKGFDKFLLNNDFSDCLIVIDEAWDVLRSEEVVKRVVALAKGYRKKGVGVIISTQNLTDMNKENVELIIKCCANYLILHLTSLELQQIGKYMHISDNVIEYLSKVDKGQGWMTVGTKQYAFQAIFDKGEYDLFNTNYEEKKGVA